MAGMRSAVTGGLAPALALALALGGAACGRGEGERVGAFCARIEDHDDRVPADDPYSADRLVRSAPYEIADEVALVDAAQRAERDGTGPVATADRLAAAEAEIARWVEAGCP